MSIIGNGDGFAASVFFIKLLNQLTQPYFITIAKINGADDSEIMRQSKHKSSVIIQRYIRIENIKKHNVATKLGL